MAPKSSKAASFAAVTAIEAGEWDDHLHLIHDAVKKRQRQIKPATIAEMLNMPPEQPHRFQPTSSTPIMGMKCGRCSQPSAAPIHTATHQIWDGNGEIPCYCTNGLHGRMPHGG